jgi:hypothetical protein
MSWGHTPRTPGNAGLRPLGVESLPVASRTHRQPAADSPLLTRRQIAERFGLSVSFLAHLPAHAGPPVYYIGRKPMYDVGEFVAWVKSRPPFGAPPAVRRKPGRPSKPPLEERARS